MTSQTFVSKHSGPEMRRILGDAVEDLLTE